MKRFNCKALADIVKNDTNGRFSNPGDAENGPHPDDCCSRLQFALSEFTSEELKLVPATIDLSDVHFIEFHWPTGQFSGITHNDMVVSDEDWRHSSQFDDLWHVGRISAVEPIPVDEVAELMFEAD